MVAGFENEAEAEAVASETKAVYSRSRPRYKTVGLYL